MGEAILKKDWNRAHRAKVKEMRANGDFVPSQKQKAYLEMFLEIKAKPGESVLTHLGITERTIRQWSRQKPFVDWFTAEVEQFHKFQLVILKQKILVEGMVTGASDTKRRLALAVLGQEPKKALTGPKKVDFNFGKPK